VFTSYQKPVRVAQGPPGAMRASAASEWFPEFVYEVVAHRRGDYLSITLISTGPLQPRAWIEQFPCDHPDACAVAVRDWLVERALEVSGMDDRILDWAFRLSERIVAGESAG
jgi:hypothetical protein